MANEAEIIELLGPIKGCPVRYACADGVGIAKGTLCQITDPRTASATDGDNQAFAGIAAMEKVASDGSESITLYTHGIFDIKCSASNVSAGERVSIKDTNKVAIVAAADLLFATVGIALADGNDSTIPVLIGSGL